MKWIGRILYIALVVIVGFFVLRFSQINAQVKYYNENAAPYLLKDDREGYISRYMTANLIDTYLKEPLYLAQSDDSNDFKFEFAIYQLKILGEDQDLTYLSFYFNEITFDYETLLEDYNKYEENNNLAAISIEVKMKDVDELSTEYYPLDASFRMPVVLLQQVTKDNESVFSFQVAIDGEAESKESTEIEKISLVLSDLTTAEEADDATRTIIAEFTSDENNENGVDQLTTVDNVIVSSKFNGMIESYQLDDLYEDENNLGVTYRSDLDVYLKGVTKSLVIYGLIVVGLTFLIFFLKPLLNYIEDKRAIRRKEEREAEKELEALEKRQTEPVIEDAEFVEEDNEAIEDHNDDEIQEDEQLTQVLEEEKTIDYNSMTVVELKALAKEMELTNYSTLKKADLIELIKQNK